MIELIGVVVPASNERQLIGACLDALARARTHLRRHVDGVDVRTIVVLDSCTDGTADVVDCRLTIELPPVSWSVVRLAVG